MRTLHQKIKLLATDGRKNNKMPLLDKDGDNIADVDQQRHPWKEYFDKLLNTDASTNADSEEEIEEYTGIQPVNTDNTTVY